MNSTAARLLWRRSGDVRRRAGAGDTLPRTTEAFVRGRVKFRVGMITNFAFSRDETMMGFGFPAGVA